VTDQVSPDVPTRSVDAVLFDFGGVYTDSPFSAMAKAGADKGITAEETIDIVFGSYDSDDDHPWHQAERGELDLEAARAGITAIGASRGVEIDLFDMLAYMSSGGAGVRDEVVERTRAIRQAGIGTALITNNIVEFREFWANMIPLAELFDVVIDSSQVGMRKPNPAIFELALAQLGGVSPDRAAFLDDFPGNISAANALGMHGILVEDDPAAAMHALAALTGPL
jgi:putative hydrolase of the HAD superfamily